MHAFVTMILRNVLNFNVLETCTTQIEKKRKQTMIPARKLVTNGFQTLAGCGTNFLCLTSPVYSIIPGMLMIPIRYKTLLEATVRTAICTIYDADRHSMHAGATWVDDCLIMITLPMVVLCTTVPGRIA